jgi:cytochrome d ubiquinol oxidase subunit II
MLPELAAAAIVVGLSAYLVLGGADFGAGFWDLTAGGARRGARVRGMIKIAMGPVWEANHVWLIFVLVVFWTAFPVAFGSVTSTLYVPLFAAAVGIIFRGAAFALRGEAATIAEARALGAAFALSSVLVPFFLGAAVGGIASGRVPVGNASGDALTSWWNATSVLVGALTVAAGAHLAAVFLAADSVRAGQPDLVRAFRARALGSGLAAGKPAQHHEGYGAQTEIDRHQEPIANRNAVRPRHGLRRSHDPIDHPRLAAHLGCYPAADKGDDRQRPSRHHRPVEPGRTR